MMTFIAVCLGILTVVHLAVLCLLFVVLLNVRRASQAVETLAYRLHEKLSRVEGAAQKLGDFASWTRSGWSKFLAVALGTAAGAWVRRRGAAKSSGN